MITIFFKVYINHDWVVSTVKVSDNDFFYTAVIEGFWINKDLELDSSKEGRCHYVLPNYIVSASVNV